MNTDDNSLTSHKWVRLMTDYCSDGIWDKNGAAASIDDLPVSKELKSNITNWQHFYDRYSLTSDEKVESELHFDAFKMLHEPLGREIAKNIKRELPDWTVVFFDSAKVPENYLEVQREVFEYEIVL